MINRKNANLSYLSDLPNGAQRKGRSSLCLCERWHLLPQHCCQWAELQTEAADPTRTWIPLYPWSSSLGTHKTKSLSLHLLFVTLGWKPLICTKTLSYVTLIHTRVIQYSLSPLFLLNCLRTMRIKPILHNQVPSCLCLWFLSHF